MAWFCRWDPFGWLRIDQFYHAWYENELCRLLLRFHVPLGYTDGICPIDNQRYFRCPDGRGYYVLKTTFVQSYTSVPSDPSPTDRFSAPK